MCSACPAEAESKPAYVWFCTSSKPLDPLLYDYTSLPKGARLAQTHAVAP